jgi:hypothetical protein
MLTRLAAPAGLCALTLLFFAPLVVHPDQVFYAHHSDILAQHLAAKQFFVQSFRTSGEFPLWCPFCFAGLPFVSDIQAAIFYPPHWLFLLLPVEWLGPAISWSIVAHVLLSGIGMYLYARSRGLSRPGAFIAAAGLMFAGKWMMHLLDGGHYILIGLAWLPLVLLALERSLSRRSFAWATAAGCGYGLLVLGTHPQWTFYASGFVLLWTLGPAIKAYAPGDRRRLILSLAWWAILGAWAVIIGLGLGAVQLLPSAEVAPFTSRGGGLEIGDGLHGAFRTLIGLVGPAVIDSPPLLRWEDHGGFGLLWIASAVWAVFLTGRRLRWECGVCLALFLFALGGALAAQALPGFRLFRVPSRILIVAGFPVAFLVGSATDALFGGVDESQLQRCSRVLGRLSVAVVILAGGFALRLIFVDGAPVRFDLYWVVAPLCAAATFALLRRLKGMPARSLLSAWIVLLLVDVMGLSWPLVEVTPPGPLYEMPACVRALTEDRQVGERVWDWGLPVRPAHTPLGEGAPMAMMHGIEPVRGYNPMDLLRYKEYLQFIGDEDRPLVPLRDTLTYPVMGDLPAIRNKTLADLLGVRYLLQPSEWPVEGPGWRRYAEDSSPTVPGFLPEGQQKLPPYTVWENTTALPKAFVVTEAMALPADRPEALRALKATDFRRRVLLEGISADANPPTTTEESETPSSTLRPVAICDYRPNRIALSVSDGSAGYLVLTDIWYPGWECTIDGQPARILRANYLFRAIELPAGAHQVVYTFEPPSYRHGRTISLATLAVSALILMGAASRRILSRKRLTSPHP